jgi:hypothetical protein
MFDDRDPPHYLQPLLSTTAPKRLLWLDCAAGSTSEHGSFVERWSHGALGTTHWTSKRGERRDTMQTYDNPADLWGVADEYCRTGRRVVLFCHDLAYQLRVSQALIELPKHGWELSRIVLERTAAWASLHDGKRSLLLCDLASWTPASFQRIAADVVSEDHDATIAAYDLSDTASECTYRAAIVREAVLQILDWIQAERLGPFRPTGSGQSYAAFRRRFLTHNLLVHDNAERLQTERAAMWTGRCEAWQHGTLTDGPYFEYDMTAAYCRIAAECDIPAVAVGDIHDPSPTLVAEMMQTHAVLAEMTVTTSVPCVPTHHGGRTLWPVGTFKTILWDPEIALALQYADSVTFHRAYRYKRAPALQDFAQWTLDTMDAPNSVHGPMVQRVAKHWSRTLVGRLGLRYRTWDDFGTQSPPDLRLVTYIDTDTRTVTDMLIAGNKRMILSDMAEAPESLPQVPGWVMSECRRRLFTAMMTVGVDNVVYCDTDSLIIVPYGRRYWIHGDEYTMGDDWARKATYARLTVNGPRNLTTETTRKMAGLPLTARQTAPLEFTGQVMRSIKESMRAGELDCVTSLPRKFVMDAPDLRRQHLPNGQTAPFRLSPKTDE